ncbi:GNAT family N-acetyltransferase [Massilia cavernae]|nr:GNAT family N-acetyltransferase [Massilia cavernae]
MIRIATINDVDAMVDVYNQAVTDQVYANCDDVQQPGPAFADAYFFGSERYIVLVKLDEEGAMLGWGALKKFSARPYDPAIAEVAVYIARARRSRGLGIRLLQQLIVHATGAGFDSLMAVIVGKNVQSIRGSALCGFAEVVRLPAIARLYGGAVDMVWMQKMLAQTSRPDRQEPIHPIHIPRNSQ